MLISSNKLQPLEQQSFNYIYGGYPTLVKSNSDKKILSDKRMSIYIDWFKEKLALYQINNCYNLSPNGCYIEGMTYKPLEKILNFPNIRIDIEDITKSLYKRNETYYLPNILKAAEHFKEKLELIINLGKDAYDLSKKIEHKYNDREDINKDLGRLTELDNKIVSFNHSQTLSFIIEPFISDITESETGTALEGLQISSKLYQKIVQTGSLHIKYLDHSIKLLKNSKNPT